MRISNITINRNNFNSRFAVNSWLNNLPHDIATVNITAETTNLKELDNLNNLMGASINIENTEDREITIITNGPIRFNNIDLEISNISYNEEVGIVVVIFKDGTKIIKRLVGDDSFDLNIAVSLAITEKLYGSKNKFHKRVEELKNTFDEKRERKANACKKKAVKQKLTKKTEKKSK